MKGFNNELFYEFLTGIRSLTDRFLDNLHKILKKIHLVKEALTQAFINK